jgi:hypothetical protein
VDPDGAAGLAADAFGGRDPQLLDPAHRRQAGREPAAARREGEPAAHKNYLLFNVREPGHYLGQCAEYCGESHAIMRMTVMAVEPQEFDAWVAAHARRRSRCPTLARARRA